jgi:flagellar motor switch protein FliG
MKIKQTTANDRILQDVNIVDRVGFFCILLGEEVSVKLFEHLSTQSVEQITASIASTRASMDGKKSLAVLETFLALIKSSNYMRSGGYDFAKDLLYRSIGKIEADKVLKKLAKLEREKQVFGYLKKIPPSQFVSFMEDESSQALAVVMAHMTSGDAAGVLRNMKDEQKVDVAMKMATIKDVSSDVIDNMSDVLEIKLKTLLAELETVGGVQVVADMLNRMGVKAKDILALIEAEDPVLAAQIKKFMFTFEDLLKIAPNGILKVLGELDLTSVAKAMKGATEEDMGIIEGCLSKRNLASFKDEVELSGRVKIKDIEEAQAKMLSIASKLIEQGIIERALDDDE